MERLAETLYDLLCVVLFAGYEVGLADDAGLVVALARVVELARLSRECFHIVQDGLNADPENQLDEDGVERHVRSLEHRNPVARKGLRRGLLAWFPFVVRGVSSRLRVISVEIHHLRGSGRVRVR